MADDLPLRVVIVNQQEVDAQLDRLTRDRTVGGGVGPGGGRARATGQVGAAAQQGASAGDAAKTGIIAGATTVALQGLRDSIRSLSSSVAGAFDPTQTAAQREAGIIGEGLAAVPLVGQAASQIFKNVVAPQLAVQEQSSSRLNSQFNSLFEAIGLGLEGEATPTRAKEEILRRFGGEGGLLERIGAIETRRAAGAVGGQQAVAEIIGRQGGIDFGEAKAQALEQGEALLKGLLPSLDDIKDKIQEGVDALKDIGQAAGLTGEGGASGRMQAMARLNGFFGTGNTGND